MREERERVCAVCSITRRLQRYTRSPEIKGRNQETSGQTCSSSKVVVVVRKE